MRPTRHRAKTAVDPSNYVHIVGNTFVKHEHAPVLVIGARTWDRYTLGRLGCPHPMAAAALNRVVQQLEIRSLADLATNVHRIGAYKGLGVTAYWTVLAILREAGYDIATVHDEPVTYLTIKARARRVQQRRKPPKKRRAGPPSEADA
jgi:hypothetical protein